LNLCVFKYFYRKKNIVPNIAHRNELERLFRKKDSFNWFTESDSFSVMVKFLSMPEYKFPVLVGLLVCIGGVSESLVNVFYLSYHVSYFYVIDTTYVYLYRLKKLVTISLST